MKSVVLRMKTFRRSRCRRTFTMHGPLQSIGYASSTKLTFKNRLPLNWYWKAWHSDHRFLRLFDRVMCVSRRHAAVMSRLHRLPKDLVIATPNGVDTVSFCPAPPPRSTRECVVVGSAGYLSEVKRFDLLIDAVKSVSQRHQIKLLIAGEGSEEMALRRQVEAIGLTNVVSFVGYQRDMATFLRSLDVFVMTSSSEGCPIAELEAMAVGLPSVVTNVGDLPVIVRHAVDGFVVPSGDTGAVAAKLLELVSEPTLRRDMGASARNRACEEFSIEQGNERTMDVFRSLIATELQVRSWHYRRLRSV